MTRKADLKKALQSAINDAWSVSQQRIETMQPEREHPQIALCIEKNRGYMMALEDITQLLYANKVF
jgi:hypothetical protein